MVMTLPNEAVERVLAPSSRAAVTGAVPEEQVVYADLLDIGMKIGMAMLLFTFTIYVLEIFKPVVPLQELPNYWSLPVGKYLQATGVETGWSWVYLLNRGDFLNFVGIAFLSAVTIVCYLRILPLPVRNGEFVFAAILFAEAVVLTAGASGILGGGH